MFTATVVVVALAWSTICICLGAHIAAAGYRRDTADLAAAAKRAKDIIGQAQAANQLCNRPKPHICKLNGPCNGLPRTDFEIMQLEQSRGRAGALLELHPNLTADMVSRAHKVR